MTIAFWCVLIAGLLPYVATLTAKLGARAYDNANPREWLACRMPNNGWPALTETPAAGKSIASTRPNSFLAKSSRPTFAEPSSAKLGARAYDNANPREWLASQSGYRRRANAAQQNAFEAFPLFAAAVIVAQLTGAPQARVDLLAVAFIVARVLHFALYLADLATMRSLAWLVGFGCAIAIFVAGA